MSFVTKLDFTSDKIDKTKEFLLRFKKRNIQKVYNTKSA